MYNIKASQLRHDNCSQHPHIYCRSLFPTFALNVLKYNLEKELIISSTTIPASPPPVFPVNNTTLSLICSLGLISYATALTLMTNNNGSPTLVPLSPHSSPNTLDNTQLSCYSTSRCLVLLSAHLILSCSHCGHFPPITSLLLIVVMMLLHPCWLNFSHGAATLSDQINPSWSMLQTQRNSTSLARASIYHWLQHILPCMLLFTQLSWYSKH